ncbi:MAG TPA: GatB/YqeY domain-containing protein [Burkholderiaceae bacterium]
MSLKDRITEDMKAAMRAKDAQRLGAIRLLLAAIKQREVDERVELDDAAVVAVVEKLGKQRRDSIEQFTRAGRDDLAARERFELDVLAGYLPRQAGADEVAAAIDAAIAATGAAGPKDMGKVMGAVKGKLAGRADMAQVSAAIRQRLGA